MSTSSNIRSLTEAEEHAWKPEANPWMIAASVMMATFMVVLDSSVANVALPHIAGNLSASTDESTWVLTSYLVSNAIMLPAAGWIARRIGRKRLLIISILIFTEMCIRDSSCTSRSSTTRLRLQLKPYGGQSYFFSDSCR